MHAVNFGIAMLLLISGWAVLSIAVALTVGSATRDRDHAADSWR